MGNEIITPSLAIKTRACKFTIFAVSNHAQVLLPKLYECLSIYFQLQKKSANQTILHIKRSQQYKFNSGNTTHLPRISQFIRFINYSVELSKPMDSLQLFCRAKSSISHYGC